MAKKLCCCLLCCAVLACLGCGGASGRVAETPVEVPALVSEYQAAPVSAFTAFVAAPIPEYYPAAGVGIVTGEAGDLGGSLDADDRNRLSESFKNAYGEGVLRGVRLAGVLGGDRVHGWPPAAPLTWVQNWRNIAGKRNSWGIPDMILAVRGLTHDRVFLVQDDILNAYGISAGVGGANGAAGYGAPCGEEFLLDGSMAQRFDKGLITVGADGAVRFVSGEAPSLAAELPALVGVLSGGAANPLVSGAFQSAWRTELDSGLPPLEPDSPVIKIDLGAAPWTLPATISEENILPAVAALPADRGEAARLTITELYCQPFGGGTTLFLVIEGFIDYARGRMAIPPFPRIVGSPVLETLLNAGSGRCEGAGALVPAALPSGGGGSGLARLLLQGIALYGIPLTDALPWNNAEKTVSVQRFSQGWIVTR